MSFPDEVCAVNTVQVFKSGGIFNAANDVCEGDVFTGVCLSTRGGGLCPGGSLSRGDLCLVGGLCPGGSLSGRRECAGGTHRTRMPSCYQIYFPVFFAAVTNLSVVV